MRIPAPGGIVLLSTAAVPNAVCAGVPVSNKASNITTADTRSTVAPGLPSPPVGDDARSIDYLMAARDAMTHGRTGEVQEALERAEARALDRGVPLLQTGAPIDDPLVAETSAARFTLESNEPARTTQLIAAAADTAAHLAS